jgi:putative SOS response-associated peptidase YedK
MCGRYVNTASTADLLSEFEAEQAIGDDLAPSWNVAPTDPVRVILQRVPGGSEPGAGGAEPVRQLRTMRWGLVPSWSKDRKGGARLINARIETVIDKPSFRKAAAARRCLIPAQGYYEWQRTGNAKVPHYLHDPQDATLAMAGLYELWRDPDRSADDPDRWLWTCTIITQQATDLLGEIHDRNPVLVPGALRTRWLDCSDEDPATARALLAEMPEASLAPRIVGAAVGNVRNNGPELLQPPDTEDDVTPQPLQL